MAAQAVNADFWYPAGLSVTVTGEVYVADYNNNRIRKIDAAGNVATVVGNGAQAFSGDGGPLFRHRSICLLVCLWMQPAIFLLPTEAMMW